MPASWRHDINKAQHIIAQQGWPAAEPIMDVTRKICVHVLGLLIMYTAHTCVGVVVGDALYREVMEMWMYSVYVFWREQGVTKLLF